MGLQRYRADEKRELPTGEVEWFARWMGGPSLAKIENCETPFGRRTVYVTGEPCSYFSLPAACKFKGKDVHGWLGFEDGKPQFHANRESYWFPYVATEVSK